MTAVEWLENKFYRVALSEVPSLFEQAKELEKQQIIDAATSDEYLTHHFINKAISNNNSIGEQYYNEKFNK